MDWAAIFEKLKTANIISHLAGLDPQDLVRNPHILIPAILLLGLLIFFKFFRTVAVLVGSVALWWAIVYTFPKGNEIEVKNICIFGAVCLGVAIYWIYVFIIKGD
ncbi:MAG: hypothetical protein GWP10_02145 [Nitrospiraceae bacterium]|nr:hypothetical protein [Nitrospiraceae bacterium]